MTVTHDAFAASLRLAAQQHGAISAQQLRECGVSAKSQRTAVADGHLIRVESTVLVVAGSADNWHRRLKIGLLALGDGAWVSHEAAAALHGLDRSNPESVEFCVLRSNRQRRLRDGIVHTTQVKGPVDVITVNGFACSTATRTILDLAASGAGEPRLAAAIDSAVRLNLTVPLVLAERLAELRGRGRYGVRLLDRLLIDSGGESMLERRFLPLLRSHGLPRPQTQRRISKVGHHVARVDFLYPDESIIVEVTGRLGHTTPADRAKDAQRRNDLQDLGYTVYEYTWGDVTRRPGYVVETLRERLRRRNLRLCRVKAPVRSV